MGCESERLKLSSTIGEGRRVSSCGRSIRPRSEILSAQRAPRRPPDHECHAPGWRSVEARRRNRHARIIHDDLLALRALLQPQIQALRRRAVGSGAVGSASRPLQPPRCTVGVPPGNLLLVPRSADTESPGVLQLRPVPLRSPPQPQRSVAPPNRRTRSRWPRPPMVLAGISGCRCRIGIVVLRRRTCTRASFPRRSRRMTRQPGAREAARGTRRFARRCRCFCRSRPMVGRPRWMAMHRATESQIATTSNGWPGSRSALSARRAPH